MRTLAILLTSSVFLLASCGRSSISQRSSSSTDDVYYSPTADTRIITEDEAYVPYGETQNS